MVDIMKEAGLAHGGFYAHFASRDQLPAEAVDRAGARTLEGLRQLTDSAAPGDALDVFIDACLSDAHLDRPEHGCTLAALGPWFGPLRWPWRRTVTCTGTIADEKQALLAP